MFYVHLFQKAMYRKKNQLLLCFSKHLPPLRRGYTEAGSRLHHEGDGQKQRCHWESAQRGTETGSVLVNITRTTAGS